MTCDLHVVYQLIRLGGVLVEKTVETTLPLVLQNKDGIVQLMQQLGNNYKQKEELMQKYQELHNIKVKN